MCGLLYILDKKNFLNIKRCNEALELQNHRGPDFSGEVGINSKIKNKFFSDLKQRADIKIDCFLGHKRLRIIDLSQNSNQPIIIENNFFLFNGEFYNFKNYDNKKTNSDTLTLFNKLRDCGIQFLNEVNGMWAIVYGDLKLNKIFLSRDRYGKKPLYYFNNKEIFIASSEIKSIYHYLQLKSREINPNSLASFFSTKLNVYPSGNTFYKNIYAVKPGEILEFNLEDLNLNKKINIKKFPLFKKKNNLSSLKINLKEDLKNSVLIRLNSDVQIGVLVSGGLDSSAILSNVLKYGKKSDVEYFYAKQFITNHNQVSEDDYYIKILQKKLGIKINEINLLDDNLKIENTLLKLAKQIEEPFNIELTSIPTYLISKRMSENNIKVSLDGIGGDEIMGGYPVFSSLANANLDQNNFLDFLNYASLSFGHSKKTKIENLYLLISFLKKKIYKKKINYKTEVFSKKFNEYIDSINIVNLRNSYTTTTKRQLLEVLKFQIPYYLKISDQFNMINSVENRSPFLDLNLFKYIFLENKYKFNNNYTKILLREILIDDLPKEIVFRKKKVGFGSSIDINKLKTNKNYERIMDNNIIRSILDKDIKKDLIFSHKSLFKNLLILSYLSNEYCLTLNL